MGAAIFHDIILLLVAVIGLLQNAVIGLRAAVILVCNRMQPNGPARRGNIILLQNAAQWD